jgi:tetratricopeptide (TPR) repeat protein
LQHFNQFFNRTFTNNIWAVPFIFVFIFITILSSRLLSDPDLGFHLNSGKYIVENFSFPDKDVFTYTSTNNDYVDLQWLFQVIIFVLYNITGYVGLSIFVTILSLLLLYLLTLRHRFLKIPLSISCIFFFTSYLIIESRLVLRPELFTFIFITIILFWLDKYYYTRKKNLYLLPVVMLIWCNVHSLFVLGFFLLGSYFISLWIKDKKIDKHFSIWFAISIVICFINPYFAKGFTFPLELFTRFDSNNIFNQYIKEFKSTFEIDLFVVKNFLFVIFICVTVILFLFTIKKRKLHEFILLIGFTYLALISIRNIPLFIIVALPIAGSSIESIKEKLKFIIKWRPHIYYGLIIFSIGIIFRLFTNSFYISNNSPYKTGFGIDEQQQPVSVSEFLNYHHLRGKIINSLGIGGWLSWSTSQPVFMDGRLEVIKENIYKEVVESWSGNGLSKLISKYKPELIVYNYAKYHTWTDQLAVMPDWKLVYMDGSDAVFAQNNYATNLPSMNFNNLLIMYHLQQDLSESEKTDIINTSPKGILSQWMEGFYIITDYTETELLKIASFCMQLKKYNIAERFFIEHLKKTGDNYNFILYALADIYQRKANNNLTQICYTNILKFDPENKIALTSQENTENTTITPPDTSVIKNTENDAITLFNSGNEKYQNKDIQGAISDYDKAIEIKPDYYKAYNNRGIIKASDLGLNNEALKDFDKAIEIKSDYSDAYLGRGSVKLMMNDISGACCDWDKASNLGNTQAKLQMDKYCHNK